MFLKDRNDGNRAVEAVHKELDRYMQGFRANTAVNGSRRRGCRSSASTYGRAMPCRSLAFCLSNASVCVKISTMDNQTFEFVVYILHACAHRWAVLPSAAYKKLSDSGCINQLLVPYYDVLHTQGTQYIVSDVEDYLCNRGYKI